MDSAQGTTCPGDLTTAPKSARIRCEAPGPLKGPAPRLVSGLLALHQAPHLRQLIDETLHSIDPSIPRPKRTMGGPKGTLSAEEIEELRRKFEEMQKQQGEGHGDDAH